jgi:hypothetical protein
MSSPREFVAELIALPSQPGVFNPWRDTDPVNDAGPDAPGIRADNLARYLQMRVGKARLVLIAEAPGFRGCKFSGIAMTSERILMNHQIKVPASAVFDGAKSRTSQAALMPLGYIEPTASITWSLLLSLGLDPAEFVLWNSFPCHPFKGTDPLTNRAPTPVELGSCAHVLPLMLELFKTAQVVAVGRIAQRTLASLGLVVPNVRHPAMGGATAFRRQIMELLSASGAPIAPAASS